uniref:Galectin n=1 Tax=Caenorhabditis tropicalis TaxID=1561998 RepID=A0A1I7T970_9PELO
MTSHESDTPLPVPYTSRLGQPLEAGQTLNVHGKINEGALVAELNLLQGGGDIAPNHQVILHVKLNFKDKKIVFNSYENGVWGKEEHESLPFQPGQDFDLRIRVLEEAFEISADNKKIHEFKHRLPFRSIEFLSVRGEVSLSGIHWGGRFYKLPWETGFPAGHLERGQRIHLYGIPKGDRWSFDLVARNQDVLFHFNPRLKEKVVVRNSHRNGFWDNEEREGEFPFKKDIGFDLTVVNEEFSIQIFINGQRFGTFQHRTQNPIGDYIGLRIDGEVEVTGIEFSH